MKPLVFLDLETTGLDPSRHEILEIGAIRVDGESFHETARLELRVLPERIEAADPDALAMNGYSPATWRDALPLKTALSSLSPLLDGCQLAGHNVCFDRSFLEAAWRRTGVTPPKMDHHILDTASLAWPLLGAGIVDSLSLSTVCRRFGISTERSHRALSDAERSLKLARVLLPVDILRVYALSFIETVSSEDDDAAVRVPLKERS